MNTIHLLPPEIAQKIAAGEVIERPVSVIKELVENSLDAAASAVRVDLASGGKALVRVIDNGCGMGREDALLCFERHSTSKISTEEDLWRISSLGFRGEALASISAVSRLVLRTSDGKEGKGTQIEREGERVLKVSDIAFPQGTTVEVRDLFFNLPARREVSAFGQVRARARRQVFDLCGPGLSGSRILTFPGDTRNLELSGRGRRPGEDISALRASRPGATDGVSA